MVSGKNSENLSTAGMIFQAMVSNGRNSDVDEEDRRKEYIERKDAERVLREYRNHCIESSCYTGAGVVSAIYDSFKNIPTADVEEVRYGKWVSASKKQGVNIGMKCSLCGSRIKYSEFFNGNHNYCHKCGAKMDGKGGTE